MLGGYVHNSYVFQYANTVRKKVEFIREGV